MSTDPAITLGQARLLVDDFAGMFRFYRDVVGLEVGSGSENDVYAGFRTGTAEVALFRRDLMGSAVGETIATGAGLGRVAIVLQVENVDAAWERMSAAGAQGLSGPTDRSDWGIRTAHVRDPEGNIVEVFTPLPSAH